MKKKRKKKKKKKKEKRKKIKKKTMRSADRVGECLPVWGRPTYRGHAKPTRLTLWDMA